jgi:tRNA uridine 5-carboxymethylaminomethyl modification enzyme
MNKYSEYEVVVIGAGHAGIEAANASARLGAKTLVLTINLDSVGLMPCNCAIGGPGRGQLLREIDAMGGLIGEHADKNYIHNRIINTSKGLAIRTLRSVVDKRQYFISIKKTLEERDNIDLRQGLVINIKKKNNIFNLITSDGVEYTSKAVVITTGTFLRAEIFWGKYSMQAGRLGEINSRSLSRSLEKMGLSFSRLRTETPPRIDCKTIDTKNLSVQLYDDDPEFFSHTKAPKARRQIPIYYTYIDQNNIDYIRDNLDKSPIYQRKIETESPKYCPSIEDKVERFSEKNRHPIFIQPEGRRTNEMYLHGLHTAFPEEIQERIIKNIKGLEKAILTRPGYGVEYDFLRSGQINSSLENKKIKGLFFAGQINGTTGYEEAAAQGVIAGINAAREIKNKKIISIDREDGYIGVLIDDITSKKVSEPYRMLTSKNEYRLIHRHDNAQFRMLKYLKEIGDVDKVKEISDKSIKLESVRKELIKNKKVKINEIYEQFRSKEYKNNAIEELKKLYKI